MKGDDKRRWAKLKVLAPFNRRNRKSVAELTEQIELRHLEREALYGPGTKEWDRINSLANLDRLDRNSIADLTKQIQLREAERNALYRVKVERSRADYNVTNTPSMFESLLNKFTTEYNYPNAANDILRCHACDPPSEPEDRVLTDCGHVYCMECFTHMLHNNRKTTNVHAIQCLAFGGDQIRDCLVLDKAQWEAIDAAVGGHKQVQYTANVSSSKSMREKDEEGLAIPWTGRGIIAAASDDVSKLWYSLNWCKAPPDGSSSEADTDDDDMEIDIEYAADTSGDAMESSGDTTDDSDDDSDEEDQPQDYDLESSFIDDGPQDEPDTEDESVQDETIQDEAASLDEEHEEHVHIKLEEEEVATVLTQGLENQDAQQIKREEGEEEPDEDENEGQFDDSFRGFSPTVFEGLLTTFKGEEEQDVDAIMEMDLSSVS